MFAPAVTNGSQNGTPTPMATRGRRRQRPASSDNTIQAPKSKRLRSDRPQITDRTFVEPVPAQETYEVKSAQLSAIEVKQDGVERPIAVAVPRRELSVRSKKTRTGDRLHKGDGTTLLVSHPHYPIPHSL
jgi:nuclear pore complex protein Nup133